MNIQNQNLHNSRRREKHESEIVNFPFEMRVCTHLTDNENILIPVTVLINLKFM